MLEQHIKWIALVRSPRGGPGDLLSKDVSSHTYLPFFSALSWGRGGGMNYFEDSVKRTAIQPVLSLCRSLSKFFLPILDLCSSICGMGELD